MIAGGRAAAVGRARSIEGSRDLHDAEAVAYLGSEADLAGGGVEALAPYRIPARRGESQGAERALAR